LVHGESEAQPTQGQDKRKPENINRLFEKDFESRKTGLNLEPAFREALRRRSNAPTPGQ
jgi:hypothetical protein